MRYICYPTSNNPDPRGSLILDGGTYISEVDLGYTDEQKVSEMGLEMNQVGFFEDTDFTPQELYFKECFIIESDNTVTFNLPKAKIKAVFVIKTNLKYSVTRNGFSYDIMIAQSSLPQSDRSPVIQSYFDTINSKIDEITTRIDEAQDATTATQLISLMEIEY